MNIPVDDSFSWVNEGQDIALMLWETMTGYENLVFLDMCGEEESQFGWFITGEDGHGDWELPMDESPRVFPTLQAAVEDVISYIHQHPDEPWLNKIPLIEKFRDLNK